METAGNITYLTGHVDLKPVRYWIDTERSRKRWWFGSVETYTVRTEFASLGGFTTRDEAHSAAKMCGFEWVRGL